jgi:secreted trypsin-like serine protease
VLLHRQIPETYDVIEPVFEGFRDGRGSRKVIAGYGRTDGYHAMTKLALYFAELQGSARLDEGDFADRDDIVLESRYRNGARISACQGDSGGPLFVLERGASRLRQIAVTSGGDAHCREVGLFAPIDGQRAMLRRMFDALMQGEQGADRNPF